MKRSLKSMLIMAPVVALMLQTAALATEADDAFQQGQIFATQKMYDKAIGAYLAAAKADPDAYGIRANVSVAIVMAQLKEYDKAAKILEMIIKSHPEYSEIWLCYKILGKVRTDQKRLGEAASAYENFLRTIPPAKLKPQDKAEFSKQISLLREQAAKGAP